MTQVTLRGNPIKVDGHFPQVGETAKPFSLVANDLADVALSKFAGQRKVLNIFPSVDTPTCATSVRKFNSDASSLANTVGSLSIFYDLSRRFTLRAQTGEQSAVDLIFTLRYD